MRPCCQADVDLVTGSPGCGIGSGKVDHQCLLLLPLHTSLSGPSCNADGCVKRVNMLPLPGSLMCADVPMGGWHFAHKAAWSTLLIRWALEDGLIEHQHN